MATDRSTEGTPVYPKVAPPSRVMRGGGAPRFFSGSERCFLQSCKLLMDFRENGTRGVPAQPPRESTRSFKESGCGGGFHMSPKFSAARESIAVISGSGSDTATTPKGGNTSELSSPERERERESPPMQ